MLSTINNNQVFSATQPYSLHCQVTQFIQASAPLTKRKFIRPNEGMVSHNGRVRWLKGSSWCHQGSQLPYLYKTPALHCFSMYLLPITLGFHSALSVARRFWSTKSVWISGVHGRKCLCALLWIYTGIYYGCTKREVSDKASVMSDNFYNVNLTWLETCSSTSPETQQETWPETQSKTWSENQQETLLKT